MYNLAYAAPINRDKFFSARVVCKMLEKTIGEGTERMGMR